MRKRAPAVKLPGITAATVAELGHNGIVAEQKRNFSRSKGTTVAGARAQIWQEQRLKYGRSKGINVAGAKAQLWQEQRLKYGRSKGITVAGAKA